MAERRKRQRISEDGTAALVSPSDDDDLPSKKVRKETNASARRSLFVRSLPTTVTTDELTELFSQNYPLKHATVVLDPATKQSKGYGFVTFADADDAERAKEEFHGHHLQGRKLRVEIAEPRVRDAAKKNDPIGAAKKARLEKLAEVQKPSKLIIRNLPWSIKEPEQLAILFRKFGKVKHATLPKVKNTQAGFGFVVMRGRKNAERALAEINGNVVDGRTLAVDWAVDKEVWEQQKQTEEEHSDDNNAVENGLDDDTAMEDAKDHDHDEDEKSDPDLDDDVKNFMKNHLENLEDEDEDDDEFDATDEENDWEDEDEDQDLKDIEKKSKFITDNSSTLFIRNLPFTILDADLKEHFMQFGPVRYARVVMDKATDRPRGTAFVCFFNVGDAEKCVRGAPRHQATGANAVKKGDTAAPMVKHSVLQDEEADSTGMYTIDGRILQITPAVERDQAIKLTEANTKTRDNDKRRTYLLSEGTIAVGTPLYDSLAPSEVKMREDSAAQRRKLIQNNPSLHLSLTRLSIRNIPRSVTSKDLKALAREAVVGFATDVKEGRRAQLSKEEEARGGDAMREAEKARKSKGKGVVRQAKIVFEGREGSKVPETSGAGRSRGYGFIEYSSHRWALMGLRWLNGHAVQNAAGKTQRLIVEFAIENAQVVERRKENEAKARLRSKEVSEAIEKGEAKKDKKALTKDQLMARTRKGKEAKGAKGKKGNKGESNEEQGVKRKRDSDNEKDSTEHSEQTKLARRQQIIAKKRAVRRMRKKKGGA